MTSSKPALLIDQDADNRALRALLRLSEEDEAFEARVRAVIASTRVAAIRTPQVPPSLAGVVRDWLLGLAVTSGDGLWRFGVPVAVGLVLGVLVGQVSADPASSGETVSVTIESLIAAPRTMESFGL